MKQVALMMGIILLATVALVMAAMLAMAGSTLAIGLQQDARTSVLRSIV